MPNARPSSGPMIPWMLGPFVRLLLWGRKGLKAVAGSFGAGREGVLDVGGALLLVGAITLAASVEAPPVVLLGGGIGAAILFVVARSWVMVQAEQTA